jgi:tartrate dehydrogenase/decarboxylase / D-malate dehydrogenase
VKELNIALIPGDGIGKETVPEAVRVLDAIADRHGGLRLRYENFPWSCEYYKAAWAHDARRRT